jgi:hypothetical protein
MRDGGGSGLSALGTTETVSSQHSAHARRFAGVSKRFVRPFLAILILCTTLALFLVAPALVPAYLALLATVFLLPRRVPPAKPSESGRDRSAIMAAEALAGSPIAGIAGESQPLPGNGPHFQPNAARIPVKARRSRSRTTATPKPEAATYFAAATWVRVGPGKFIRSEGQASHLSTEDHYDTDVHNIQKITGELSATNPSDSRQASQLHACILETAILDQGGSEIVGPGVSYSSEPTARQLAAECCEVGPGEGGLASDLHADLGDVGSGWSQAGGEPVAPARDVASMDSDTDAPREFREPRESDEKAEVSSMYLRRVRDEDRIDGPPVWERDPHYAIESGSQEQPAASTVRDGDDNGIDELDGDSANYDEASEEVNEEAEAPVCVPCRPWPRVRPASSRSVEARERGRDPRPSRSSTPGWTGRSAARRGLISRTPLPRPSAS